MILRLLLSLIVFSNTAFADQTAADIRVVGEAFAKNYAQTYIVQSVDGVLLKYAADKAGTEIAANAVGPVSTALGFYSVYTGAVELNNARTDSAIYYGAVSTVGAIISMFPGFQWVALVVVGMKLFGAGVANHFTGAYKKLQAEIIHIENQTREVIVKELESETAYYGITTDRFSAIMSLFAETQRKLKDQCGKAQIGLNFSQLVTCSNYVHKAQDYLEAYLILDHSLKNTMNRFLTYDQYYKLLKEKQPEMAKDIEKLKAVNIPELKALINKMDGSLLDLLKANIKLAADIDPELVELKRKNFCKLKNQEMTNQILELYKKTIRLKASDDFEHLLYARNEYRALKDELTGLKDICSESTSFSNQTEKLRVELGSKLGVSL